MPDMLVKLYALPDASALYKSLEEKGIRIIRPMTPNKHKVHEFIVKHFGDGWASEIDTAITFTESEEGLEFELDNGRTLPCAVQLELDVSTYSRLYLYNTISNKWQFLNTHRGRLHPPRHCRPLPADQPEPAVR